MTYAYWRDVDGSRCNQDDDSHAPTELLAEYGTIAEVKENGISWEGFAYKQLGHAIYSSVVIVDKDGRELNETDTARIVRDAASEVIKELKGGKPIPPSTLLKKVNKEAANFLRKPTEKRILVTDLSMDGCPSSPITLDDCEISFVERSAYPYPKSLTDHPSYVSPHIKKTKYQAVAATTEQTTVFQAFDIGISQIDYIRGVWNYIITFQSLSFGGSIVPTRRWIGKIQLGPIHTLHDEENSPANELYWYEPDYVDDIENYKPTDNWDELEKHRKNVCDNVAKSPFKEDLIKLFARYAKALDQANLDVCFIMLWGLLEKMTNTIGGNYDTTIKRAVWDAPDRKLASELLHEIRWRRNQYVHAASSSDDREHQCWITKKFVDGLMSNLLGNPFQVKNLKEFGECLSLLHSVDRLKQLRGKRFRKHAPLLKASRAGNGRAIYRGSLATHISSVPNSVDC